MELLAHALSLLFSLEKSVDLPVAESNRTLRGNIIRPTAKYHNFNLHIRHYYLAQ